MASVNLTLCTVTFSSSSVAVSPILKVVIGVCVLGGVVSASGLVPVVCGAVGAAVDVGSTLLASSYLESLVQPARKISAITSRSTIDFLLIMKRSIIDFGFLDR